ncbi:MAG: phospho-sugar mutase [Flavobacteriaceae bacterium]|nr:phospho-sugar mutase [Flavobacteriaceae bacterium]
MTYIKPEILDRINRWLTPDFDKATQDAIKDLIAFHPTELEERFYKNLEFGTGGMRGIMGLGDHRINKYTLGKATQGIANYLTSQFENEPLRVAIAYDCRRDSDTLARVVAEVFSANGIEVYLFDALRPTPLLSFAVTNLSCQCGIVLTASHNPPEYNGYKVYWQDGGQLVPPQDQEIIDIINQLEYRDINFKAKDKLIKSVPDQVEDDFISQSVKHGAIAADASAKADLKIVFTPLHGTAITIVPQALKAAGYEQVHIVEAQAKPDGSFPTVKSPNPEEPEALAMALDLAKEQDADIVFGTDPDSDRLGIAVKDDHGNWTLLNGNQTMVAMTEYLLSYHQTKHSLPKDAFVASTIVSTPMMSDIAASYGVECKIGLTGFKWIAKMIKDFPQQTFIGGGEESFGYMVGDFVRDKDAVTAILLACDIAAQQKALGRSFYSFLQQLYLKYGYYNERLVSFVKKGIDGAQEIQAMMHRLRQVGFKRIDQSQVIRVEDYKSSIAVNPKTNHQEKLAVPSSNVLIYYTEDGTKVAARPSGTEPKIKFYVSVYAPIDKLGDLNDKKATTQAKIDRIIKQVTAV